MHGHSFLDKLFHPTVVAILGLLVALQSVSSGADQTKKRGSTDYSSCSTSDSEKEFFKKQKTDSPVEAQKSLQNSPCRGSEKYSKAFGVGFSESFEARKYLPTFGKFKLPIRLMNRISSSDYACVDLKSNSPEERACCLSGYALGEAAFKERLKSSNQVPYSCQLAFSIAQSVSVEYCGQWAEDSKKPSQQQCSVTTMPSESWYLADGCQDVCFSFGWNEGIAPCLADVAKTASAQQAQSNRAIDFERAYREVGSNGTLVPKNHPSRATTAK